MGVYLDMDNNQKKMYVRPEDVCDLILANLSDWNTRDKIKDNVFKIKSYFKKERIDKLQIEIIKTS